MKSKKPIVTNQPQEITVLADNQRAVLVAHLGNVDTAVSIVRVALVKLQKSQVRRIELRCTGNIGSTNVAVDFDPGSASKHRRKIDWLSSWVEDALAK